MTDKDKLKALLDKAGIVYDVDIFPPDEDGTYLEIEAKTGPNNGGYSGFSAVFSFDLFGNLRKVDIAE